jgi:predicted GNAT family acetyltransferase
MQDNNSIEFSPVESSRFKYKIYRGNITNIDEGLITGIINNQQPDILILRLPVDFKSEHYKLTNLGYPVLHCDTMVYYFCSLAATTITPIRNNLEFHLVTSATQYLVDELTEELFDGYKSHYFSNPFLKKELILQGYKEWAQSFINEKDSNKFSWYITLNGIAIAYVIYQIVDNDNCEGILSGVKSKYAGKGIYTDIMRFAKKYFKDKGLKVMKNSTQIQNYSVQKTWINEGFRLKQAFDTYHINCFLSNKEIRSIL